MRYFSKESGFTLIEVIIVVAVMAIMVGVGYSGMREFARRQALTSAVRALKADLQYAQEEALAGKKPATCSTGILNGYEFYWVHVTQYHIKANCTNNSGIVVRSRTLQGVRINNPPQNPILFKPLGQGTNIVSGTEVDLTVMQEVTGNTGTVTVRASGEIL